MTVTTTPREARTACDGVTTQFPVRFQFLPGSLTVKLIDVSTNAETVLAEGVHYAITGDAVSGRASVTTFAVYPAGKTLVRRRETPIEQPTQFTPNDGLPAQALNDAIDRPIMIAQEVADDLGRALLLPEGEAAEALPDRADRVGRFLGFDSAGHPIAVEPVDALRQFNVPVIDCGTWSDAAPINDFPALGVARVLLPGASSDAFEHRAMLAREVAVDTSIPALRLGRGGLDGGAVILPVQGEVPFASGGGAIDDSAALHAADALDDWALWRGEFRLQTDLTITRTGTIPKGAMIVVDACTLTFETDPSAGQYQIFKLVNGGQVRGLQNHWIEWFIGDAKASVIGAPHVDCSAALRAAFAATAENGVIRTGPGRYLYDGVTPIEVYGASLAGASNDGFVLRWAGPFTNGFAANDNHDGKRGGFLRGFRFEPNVPGTIPVSGTAVYVNQSDREVDDFVIVDAYDGLVFDNIVSCSCSDFFITGTLRRGLTALNAISGLNIEFFEIQALSEYVTLTAITGTLSAGDAVTLSSGSNGGISAAYSGGRFRILMEARKPAIGDIITGPNGSGTVSSVTVCHAQGGMRWENDTGTGFQESIFVDNGSILGGEFTWTAYGTGAVGRAGNAAYNRVTSNVYFDTSWSGANLNGLSGCVIDGWFATSRTRDAGGIGLFNCIEIRVSAQTRNNAGAGIYVDGSCSDIELYSSDHAGNGVNYSAGAASSVADILIAGAPTRISIIGGRTGFENATVGKQAPRGLFVNGSHGLTVIGLQAPLGRILSLSNDPDQTWFGVPGVPARVPISSVSNAANDAAAAAAGVPIGGFYRNGSVQMVRVS